MRDLDVLTIQSRGDSRRHETQKRFEGRVRHNEVFLVKRERVRELKNSQCHDNSEYHKWAAVGTSESHSVLYFRVELKELGV